MVRRVAEVLTAGAIVVQPPWHSFEDGVRGLVEVLVTSGQLAAARKDEAARAVIDRETMASTAVVEIGVSIPHARVAGVDGLIAAMAVSPSAVFYAHAGVPITIMALVLSSPVSTGEQLNFLSSLSMLLQSASTRHTLQGAVHAAEVMEIIRTQERSR